MVRTLPDPPPPLETHLVELFREGGGVKNVAKMIPPFFGSKIMNLSVFFDFEPKSFSGSGLHKLCMARSGTSAYAVYALFSHFCYVGGLGDLSDPVVPTPRVVSGDVVTVYAY